MRKKDFGNTFNINKPQDLEQKMNADADTYNSTQENGDTQLKNEGFTQMYNTYTAELAELAVDNGLARAILDIMATNMELNNTYIVSQKDLAKVFNKTERSIRDAIKTLKDRDFITVFKFQRQNVYFINPRIFCKASANYKVQRLIKVYVDMNQDKDYREQHQSLNMSALDNPEYLVYKKNFAKENHVLDRPSNMEIHKQNLLKEAISNLTEEQLNLILLNANKTLTDEEIAKIKADSEQKIKANQASQEYLEALKQEQELYDKTQELEKRLDFYKRLDANEVKDIDPENPFNMDLDTIDDFECLFGNMPEPDPIDYLVDPWKD